MVESENGKGKQEYKLTKHAEDEIARRKIPRELLEQLLYNPEEIGSADRGREVWQSSFVFPNKKQYILRAIIERTPQIIVVVTVYKTSRIHKYRMKK